MQRRSAEGVWDLWAVGLSTACVVHCLAPVLFVALLPSALLAQLDHRLHLALVLLAVPITLFVVWSEPLVDRQTRAFRGIALLGLGLLLVAATLIESEALELPMTLGGGLLLVGAHLWRWRRGLARHPVHNDEVMCSGDEG